MSEPSLQNIIPFSAEPLQYYGGQVFGFWKNNLEAYVFNPVVSKIEQSYPHLRDLARKVMLLFLCFVGGLVLYYPTVFMPFLLMGGIYYLLVKLTNIQQIEQKMDEIQVPIELDSKAMMEAIKTPVIRLCKALENENDPGEKEILENQFYDSVMIPPGFINDTFLASHLCPFTTLPVHYPVRCKQVPIIIEKNCDGEIGEGQGRLHPIVGEVYEGPILLKYYFSLIKEQALEILTQNFEFDGDLFKKIQGRLLHLQAEQKLLPLADDIVNAATLLPK